MSAMSDFYEFYQAQRNKYNLKMTYRSSQKETKIVIFQNGTDHKELVKIIEEDRDICFVRAKRELEERLKTRCSHG